MFSSDPPRAQTPEEEELVLWRIRGKGGGVSWLFMGEESWEGEAGEGGTLPLQLGFKGLLPQHS